MKLIRKTLLITFIVSLSQLTLAAGVEDLYSAAVQVSDQSSTQRQKSFSRALAKVLIKTTGKKDIMAHPGVSQALAQANNYMVKYAYLTVPSVSSFEKQPASEASHSTRVTAAQMPQGVLLSVQFAKASVDELIRTLGLPIWPSNRPQILVWVVEQTASGYRFVETDDRPESLESSFEYRGLPFQLPLYDLDDQLALNPLAAWSLNQQQLREAAQRYGVDHWVVLRYSQLSGGGVRGSWYLSGRKKDFAGDRALLNTLQAATNEEFLSACVDQIVDRFARQMSYFANAEASLFRLVVENIGNFTAFTQLNNFLEGLEIVNAVKVRSIDGDTLVLDLATEGESRVLLRALNKESRLSRVVQVGDDAVEPSAMSPLSSPSIPGTSLHHFRWQAAR